ncbi:retrovirus-related pol polyprotein from transposon TNT 1-94 [Tanacetum coccineum]
MHADLKYVESLEDELDELESDKAEFSNMYDMLLQECVSKRGLVSIMQSSFDLDEITELQCLYLYKVRECDCLAQKLSEQTEFINCKTHPIPVELLDHKAHDGQSISSSANFVDKYLCTLSKAKQRSFKSKIVPSSKGRLNLLHMDLCGPMRVASINGKKYILIIVDDYSRYTWTLFLRSKDETTEKLKDYLMMIPKKLQASVISVLLTRGTESINKSLNAFL